MSVPIVGANNNGKPVNPVLVAVIGAIVAFVLGTVFGIGRSTNSLDNLIVSVNRLENAVTVLSEKYSVSDKQTAQELQKIEDHLNYDDNRLDILEGSSRKSR